MCSELKDMTDLYEFLKHCCERSQNLYECLEKEDEFEELIEAPPILPQSKFQLNLSSPSFSSFPVSDLFQTLGPVTVFSTKYHWTPPRIVDIHSKDGEGLGFSVRGSAPVVVVGVEPFGLAEVNFISTLDYKF